VKVPPGITLAQATADLTAPGLVANASVTREWSRGVYAQQADLTELVNAVESVGRRVADGNREDLEQMLASQAIALNTIFAGLMNRALRSELMAQFESYLRLALRAQSQCRTTAETLAQMKMPPVFANQANIATGPQQVNNLLQAEAIRRWCPWRQSTRATDP
jgi:hypothetical protein